MRKAISEMLPELPEAMFDAAVLGIFLTMIAVYCGLISGALR
jgi:hypothetical protein